MGIQIVFKGDGINEVGFVASIDAAKAAEMNIDIQVKPGQELVAVDAAYFRPTEVDLLIGDATKANEKLGWKPKFTLPMLVADMVQSDVKLMQKEKFLKDNGYNTLNYFE